MGEDSAKEQIGAELLCKSAKVGYKLGVGVGKLLRHLEVRT